MDNDYIKPYSDIFVKYLFGSKGHEDILLSFINDVREDASLPRIKQVEILNPFNIKSFIEEKGSILDVKATDESGRWYNVEIQATGNSSFKHRALFYWAKLYSSQLEVGQIYSVLQPAISINLLNFNLIRENDKYHNIFHITNVNDAELVLTDHLNIHFIELSKFPKELRKMKNHLEIWLYYFQNEGRKKDMKLVIKNDEVLGKAHRIYKEFTADEQMRDMYEAHLKFQRDHATLLAEGIAEAKAKGKAEGIIFSAKRMLEKGFDVETISEVTGLTVDEVNNLIEK